MCIEIIRNYSLVGGRALAEARTSTTERITLYCTWRPLTTRPHVQVIWTTDAKTPGYAFGSLMMLKITVMLIWNFPCASVCPYFMYAFIRCRLTGLIASAGGDDCIQVFVEDKASGDEDQPSFIAAAKADTFEVNGLDWNPCLAGLLASCSDDGSVRLWNVKGCSLL